ncbi:spindle and kinetochore-associated protein 1-like, partial [Phasianus colchicus]
ASPSFLPSFLPTSSPFSSSSYMRGRLTLAQINASLQILHAAAASKYKILHQNPKSMTSSIRSLYHRFREEETKETKGEIFVVEADLKEFTQVKMDRRFHAVLNVLRHCQRLREVRGARLVRYVLC